MIFEKDKKQFSGGKRSFSTNGAGAVGHTWCGRVEPSPTSLAPYEDINSKWIIGLNIKILNYKGFRKNIGENFSGSRVRQRVPRQHKGMIQKEKPVKLNFIKI